MIKIIEYNEVYVKVLCDYGISKELWDHFSFYVPGYKHMQKFKNRIWDGKIRLYSHTNNLIFKGLINQIKKFAEEREYKFETFANFVGNPDVDLIKNILKTVKLTPYDYQIEAVYTAIKECRNLFLSPTSSGKSLIIYLIQKYFNVKTLIIVPTTSLIHQLSGDFDSYAPNNIETIHKIFSGQDKTTDERITISTWQSAIKMTEQQLHSYDMVIVDECHLAKAKSIQDIMKNMPNCILRFGFTGTLDGTETNAMVLEGLFGRIHKTISTANMIDRGYASKLDINCIILEHKKEDRKLVSKMSYKDELEFIVTHQKRNKFIRNLAKQLQGNTLILFLFVDKHGKQLFEEISKLDKDVYFIHGAIKGEVRNEIRQKIETSNKMILVASLGTTSTGVSMKNLHNIISASPSKSRIRVLQSLGRILRLSDNKDKAVLYDIADNLSYGNKDNITLTHFMERVKYYSEENFNYKISTVEI